MKHRRRMVTGLAAATVLAGTVAHAGWTLNGSALSAYVSQSAAITGDGAGNVIIAWQDWRSGTNLDIYAQKLDGYGEPLWTTGGVAACAATGNQQDVRIATDGAGGAFLIWVDYRAGNNDIYAQHLDAEGNALFGTGLAVAIGTDNQLEPEIAADGAGGVYLAFDRISPQYDVYAGRINAAGQLSTPQSLGISGSYERYARLAPDGVGGAVIAWQDTRNGNTDIYAQRVDTWLSPQWDVGGLPVCTQTGAQDVVRVMADGGGNVILAWNDQRSGNADIYAQKLNRAGTGLWTSGGVAVCAVADNQMVAEMCSDGAEGAIFTWLDSRSSVYAQRVNAFGVAQWAAGGVVVSTYRGNYPRIAADGTGGAIIAWDTDYQETSAQNVYAQRVSGSGTIYGPAAGVPLCVVLGQQSLPRVATDGAGGAGVVWDDYRNQEMGGTYPLVTVQRLERNLFWGYPAPAIAGVRDVPGDQGGYLYVDWDASRLDPWPNELIDSYSIWKAVDAKSAAAKLAAGEARLAPDPLASLAVATGATTADGEKGALAAAADGRTLIRLETLGDKVHYWELVAEMAANGYERYSKRVATDFDSTGTHFARLHFQVCAHAYSLPAAWTSRPDSGYSVDNLAPAAPLALVGAQDYDPLGLVLSWRANREPDLDSYRVYRGTSADFVPGPVNLLASPADTAHFDAGSDWSDGWWYKVAAVDVHGNESGYAVLAPDDLTGTDEPGTPPAPRATFLAQNAPNPFNPRTTIRFDLARAGEARLEIYGADGRLVRTLLAGALPAGRHEVVWDGCDQRGRATASGVYLCRLAAGETRQQRKMVLMR